MCITLYIRYEMFEIVKIMRELDFRMEQLRCQVIFKNKRRERLRHNLSIEYILYIYELNFQIFVFSNNFSVQIKHIPYCVYHR